MATFEKIKEIILPNPINKPFTKQSHQKHTDIDLLRILIHDSMNVFFAKGYTMQKGDDMFYHEVLHTRINAHYNEDNIVTEDDSQEKKILSKKTQKRRSINEVLTHKIQTMKVNKVNVSKDKDDTDSDVSNNKLNIQSKTKGKKKPEKLRKQKKKILQRDKINKNLLKMTPLTQEQVIKNPDVNTFSRY